MAKETKGTKQTRVKVKDLSSDSKKLSGKDMKKVKGGTLGDVTLKSTHKDELS
ncbi:MAG TPA: hypothetical protein VF546_24260 [Pyrinomonadaceae bacterium]|jgi:hypothetical protein